jgi:uncharacterized protein (DUF849 family)
MEKQIITAAITGASTIPSLSPNLLIPSKQIADSAIEAAEAGAAEINLSIIVIHMYRHVRVGLGDNIYIKKGVFAKSNAQLVEKVVQLAEILNREVATPDDARGLLRLKEKDKVNF